MVAPGPHDPKTAYAALVVIPGLLSWECRPHRSTLSNIDKFWKPSGIPARRRYGRLGQPHVRDQVWRSHLWRDAPPIKPCSAYPAKPAAKAGVCIYAMTSEAIFTTDHVRTINEDVAFESGGRQSTHLRPLDLHRAPTENQNQGSRTTHLLSGCLPRRAPAHSSREAEPVIGAGLLQVPGRIGKLPQRTGQAGLLPIGDPGTWCGFHQRCP